MERQERYSVNFPVNIMWQDRSGITRQLRARCVDLSCEGIRIETPDRLETGTTAVVNSNDFGRMGHVSTRYCRREGMKYSVGLSFTNAFTLSDPTRQKILQKVTRTDTRPELS